MKYFFCTLLNVTLHVRLILYNSNKQNRDCVDIDKASCLVSQRWNNEPLSLYIKTAPLVFQMTALRARLQPLITYSAWSTDIQGSCPCPYCPYHNFCQGWEIIFNRRPNGAIQKLPRTKEQHQKISVLKIILNSNHKLPLTRYMKLYIDMLIRIDVNVTLLVMNWEHDILNSYWC